ncbi:unnamed protein product, partial [Vitis vinifera]
MKLPVPTGYHPYCSKVQTLPLIPAIKPTFRRSGWARMDSTVRRNRTKHKVVVIMGATGTGKSKLSIDLATRFPAEIINSDKIQIYSGLDITTNKIQMHERQGVPHHLLGDFDSSHAEITPSQFRSVAAAAISDISSRRKLPVLAGGSNSFIHALLVDRFDSESDPFNGSDSVSTELRYRCCFLWVDVSFAVLSDYLSKRVDEMLGSGMLEELAKFYDPDEDESRPKTGLRKAIGVPEFDRHFRNFEEAVKAIKDNTCHLAKKQIEKILRMRGAGWDLKRLDATEAFRVLLSSDSGKKSSEIWEKQVVEPSVKFVRRFLEE